MHPEFVLGLIAGEGCFSANMTVSESARFGIQKQMSFHLGMADENREMIDSLQTELNIGDIKNHQSTRLQVQRNDDVDELIKYIEKHRTSAFEQSAKFHSYVKWRNLWNDRDDLINTLSGVMEFATRATQINPDDARRGRSVEEIHEIIKAETPVYRDREALKQELEENDHKFTKTAESIGCRSATVSKWAKKHGLSQ